MKTLKILRCSENAQKERGFMKKLKNITLRVKISTTYSRGRGNSRGAPTLSALIGYPISTDRPLSALIGYPISADRPLSALTGYPISADRPLSELIGYPISADRVFN